MIAAYAAPHIGRALACVAALLAWRISRLRPQHRPLAIYLALIAAADLVRWVAAPALNDPAFRYGLGLVFDVPGPYSGLRRAAFHVDQALVLTGPIGLIAVAARVLAGRRPDHVIGAGALGWVALCVSYPQVRGSLLTGGVYPRVEWASVGAVGIATMMWLRQPRWPGFPEVIVWIYAATTLSLLVAGPYATTNEIASWWSAWGPLLTCVATACVVQVAWWRAVRVE